MLQTTTLAECTLVLLKQLQQLQEFSYLRLVGGTALALQLGHRQSVDLDFFGTFDMSREDLVKSLKKKGFEVRSNNDGNSIHLLEINNVKVDIVRYPYEWLDVPIEEDGVKMAGLKDIAAMKMEAITNRGSRKDFVDVYFLLQHFSLSQMMELYLKKYPKGSPLNVMRSLIYFVDAEKNPMPTMFVNVSWDKMRLTIQKEVACFSKNVQ
jgi:predicted nucleotidyltransferase component of viral defense system